jgi:hypothetical protein
MPLKHTALSTRWLLLHASLGHSNVTECCDGCCPVDLVYLRVVNDRYAGEPVMTTTYEVHAILAVFLGLAVPLPLPLLAAPLALRLS